jgi:hypothetical protein
VGEVVLARVVVTGLEDMMIQLPVPVACALTVLFRQMVWSGPAGYVSGTTMVYVRVAWPGLGQALSLTVTYILWVPVLARVGVQQNTAEGNRPGVMVKVAPGVLARPVTLMASESVLLDEALDDVTL